MYARDDSYLTAEYQALGWTLVADEIVEGRGYAVQPSVTLPVGALVLEPEETRGVYVTSTESVLVYSARTAEYRVFVTDENLSI